MEQRVGRGPEPVTGPAPGPADLARRVRAAHADLAEREGRLREHGGGGALRLPGIRLMSSGLAKPQWNGADVTEEDDVASVDMAAVRRWYAARGVPWGVRVPEGMPWPYGRRLLTKRVMVLAPADLRDPPEPDGVVIRVAGPADLDTYARVDAAAFGDEVGPTAEWARPTLGAEGFRALLAVIDGTPVGVAYAGVSSGTGGPSAGIFGVGVLAEHRRRGIGAALTARLVRWAAGRGADLVWLNPDDDRAARLYTGLGFREVPGFDIYVDA